MATGDERTGEGGFDEPLRRVPECGTISDGRFSAEQDAEGRGSGEGDENRTSCTSPDIISDSRVMGSFFFFLLLLVLSEQPCPEPVLSFLVYGVGALGEDVRFWEDFGLGLEGACVRGDGSMVTTREREEGWL